MGVSRRWNLLGVVVRSANQRFDRGANNDYQTALFGLLLTAAVALAIVPPERAPAQIIIGGRNLAVPDADADGDVDLASNVFLPADRIVLRRLSRARELLKQDRYGEAVRYLGAILDGPEDYFFQPDKIDTPEIYRSLKSEAQRLIAGLPRDGREQYRLQYGTRARQLLSEAVTAGSADRLAEVAQRYFHTESGYEATFLLGLYHLDHAEPLAAALTLQRLREAVGEANDFEPMLSLAAATCWLQAGNTDRAEEVLSQLKDRVDESTIEIAGQQVALFGDKAESIEWLLQTIGPQQTIEPPESDRWAMFRGNASRNAAGRGSAPLLNLRWRIPATDDPRMEEHLRRVRLAFEDNGIPILPGLHPLAVDDVVLMRTSRNLLAVDFPTGKRLWEVPVDDPLESMLGSGAAGALVQQSPQLAAALGTRMWDDATYGTLSSDGRLAFTIEGLTLGIGGSSSRSVIINGRRVNSNRKPHNRLAAHDIRSGKLKWHIGGAADEFSLPEPETFFLGPPLPLMGRLFVLAETKGKIRLLALDAASGEVIWSQQLAIAEQGILVDPMRRLTGASPSYADGILVCPTSTGAVVAVDLATRSLMWGYRYGRREDLSRQARFVAMQMRSRSGPDLQQRWADAGVAIVEGYVLVTPVESNQLHCLDLRDGQLIWKQPREDDLYLAHVYQGNAVMVGRRKVRALRISETLEADPPRQGRVKRPKPAWDGRAVDLPDGSVPSGRGFFSGGRYFIPLSTAEVVAVDLSAGRIDHVSKSRKGVVPGNLICYKGRVISQGLDGLETFYQLDTARQEADRRLADQPDDPVALCLRAEILLDQQKYAEAIVSFRRAYELDDTPRTRTLLRDALLDGLRLEFAAHRDRSEEIEPLLDTPEQRATYLRLMAIGCQQAGEWEAALDHYLKLADLEREDYPMVSVTKAHCVRLDRWLQARLASLRAEMADPSLLEAAIEQRRQAATEDDAVAAIKQFLEYFGNQPAAKGARAELTRRLIEEDQALAAEMTIWRDYHSSEAAVAGRATAQLAQLLAEVGRDKDAAICYRRLAAEFPEVVCLDDKTGKTLFDALPHDGPVAKLLHGDDPWPTGKVISKPGAPSSSRVAGYGRFALPLRGGAGPFFANMQVQFDQNTKQIIGHNDLGKPQWQIPFGDPGQRHTMGFNRVYTHGRACGHLLMLMTGTKIMAMDTLGSSGNGSPKRLWSRDLTDPDLNAVNLRQLPIQIQIGAIPWGIQRLHFSRYQPGTSTLGPVSGRYICFQHYRNLTAVDPLDGKVLWVRHGTAPGSHLFGDDEFLFAVAPDKDEAVIYRALDGELLGRRKVPRRKTDDPFSNGAEQAAYVPFNQSCAATLGRQLLLWKGDSAVPTLRLFDVWQQEDVWPARKFAPGAKMSLIANEAVGVFEPDGHFVLLALPDGGALIDTKLEPEKGLTEIIVHRCGDDYVLATNAPPENPPPNVRRVQPIATTLFQEIDRGRVYLLDRHGVPRWPEPANVKDQHLLLSQPGKLPLLTFASQVYDSSRSGNQRYQVSILCLDKRTGRVAYRGGFFYPTSNFDVVGDLEKKTISFTMNRNAVTLILTNDPDDGPTAAEGLLKAIRKVVE